MCVCVCRYADVCARAPQNCLSFSFSPPQRRVLRLEEASLVKSLIVNQILCFFKLYLVCILSFFLSLSLFVSLQSRDKLSMYTHTSFQNPGNYFAILVGEFAGVRFRYGPVFHLWFEQQRPVCRGGERCRARLARRLVYSGSRLIITRAASRSLSPRHFAPPRKDSFPPARHALFRESPIHSGRSRTILAL